MFYELRGTIVSPNSQFKKWFGIAIGNNNAKAIQESENPERTMNQTRYTSMTLIRIRQENTIVLQY